MCGVSDRMYHMQVALPVVAPIVLPEVSITYTHCLRIFSKALAARRANPLNPADLQLVIPFACKDSCVFIPDASPAPANPLSGPPRVFPISFRFSIDIENISGILLHLLLTLAKNADSHMH